MSYRKTRDECRESRARMNTEKLKARTISVMGDGSWGMEW